MSRALALVSLGGLVVFGCGGSGGDPAPTREGSTPPASTAGPGTAPDEATTVVGETLTLFALDQPGEASGAHPYEVTVTEFVNDLEPLGAGARLVGVAYEVRNTSDNAMNTSESVTVVDEGGFQHPSVGGWMCNLPEQGQGPPPLLLPGARYTNCTAHEIPTDLDVARVVIVAGVGEFGGPYPDSGQWTVE